MYTVCVYIEVLIICVLNVVTIFAAYALGRYNQPKQGIRKAIEAIAKITRPKVTFMSPTKMRTMLEVEKAITNE